MCSRVCVRARARRQCTKAALFHLEKDERQVAAAQADKGPRKTRAEGSAGGGQEAAARSKELRAVLDLAEPYYFDAFEDRFIKVLLDPTTGQPTEDSINYLKETLVE